MLFIDNQNITDPRINLAIEEFAVKKLDIDQTYLLFYINEPSIIIGKNQNTIEEINVNYVEEKGIHVVRRLSGGGAVYHDMGNLNFSFITRDDGDSFRNFRKFTEPVIAALHELGVKAELQGRNDILVDGKKISGNAQFSTRGRMFSHGTLMFDVQLEDVVEALNVKMEKIQSKGIKSIRSRVTNIREHLDQPLTIEQFKQVLLKNIFGGKSEISEYKLSDTDWKEIEAISAARYQKWDWNYGKSPAFNMQRSKRFPVGLLDVRFDVKQGLIQNCQIFGDFFGIGEVSDVEKRLVGARYDRQGIEEALTGIDVESYLGGVTKEEFVELLYG